MTITLNLREKINWEQMLEMTQEMLDKYGPFPCQQCGAHELTLYRKKAYEGPWLCFECNWNADGHDHH
jgi:ribosomal protein L37AE/L43A